MAAFDRATFAERAASVDRLARAAGFRNLVVRAYADLDLARVHEAATSGPADLRAFLKTVRGLIES